MSERGGSRSFQISPRQDPWGWGLTVCPGRLAWGFADPGPGEVWHGLPGGRKAPGPLLARVHKWTSALSVRDMADFEDFQRKRASKISLC